MIIERRRDDTAVGSTLPVEAFEMATVMRQDCPAQRMSTGQNVRIRSGSAALLLRSHDIVAPPPELFNHRQRKILIRVEERRLLPRDALFAFLALSRIACSISFELSAA
jgi:hypothetical protein